jgi:hypothetical protein
MARRTPRRTPTEWHKLIYDIVEKHPNHGASFLGNKIGCSAATFRKYANDLVRRRIIYYIDKGTARYPDYRYYSISRLELVVNQPLRLILERLQELEQQYKGLYERGPQDHISHQEAYSRWRGVYDALDVVNDVINELGGAVDNATIKIQLEALVDIENFDFNPSVNETFST